MTDAERERLTAKINNPDTGTFMRRALRRALAGVVAIGPVDHAPNRPEPPTKSDRVVAVKRHTEAVEAELAAVDQRIREIEKLLPPRPDPTERVPFVEQERRSELRQLLQLRTMLEQDRLAGPILTDRSGDPVDDRMRAAIKFRSREMAESFWADAQRADSEGDYRRARQLRRDALRSRMVAEYEAALRPSLPGYGINAWT